MNPLGYCISYIAPLAIVAGFFLGGLYHFLTPVITFLVIPLLDLFVGTNDRNPSEQESVQLKDRKIFRIIMFIYSIMQISLVIWGAYVVTHVFLTKVELIGFVFSIGLTTGAVGITIAHEMSHRSTAIERFFAKVLLLTVCYMHFFIEHVRGHHVNVATKKDPATARFGQSVYSFYPQTLIGSFRNAWNLELVRLEKINRQEL